MEDKRTFRDVYEGGGAVQEDTIAETAALGTTDLATTNPMASLLDSEYAYKTPRHGDILQGVIMQITPGEILVDVGSKSEGIISGRELERMDPEVRQTLQVGQDVLAYVVRPEDQDGNIVLSLTRAQMETDWRRAEELYAAEEIFEAQVAGHNKGGLIVRIGRVRGFVPSSQLVSVRRRRSEEGEEEDPEESEQAKLVGKMLRFKIIELDRRRNRLILSERAAAREWRREQKEKLLSELQENEVRTGIVSSLCDFGAFVDLGGADGLIHLSELSWGRVAHPREVLSVGDEVQVYVLHIDRERRRIALSLKRLQPEPWSQIDERYEIGQLVQGTITKITNFGAFARLDGDVEGLIHISELSDQRIGHPREVVQEGQTLDLRVIRIDSARKRIGLSLRRVNDTEIEDYTWEPEGEVTDQGAPEEDASPQEPEQ
ncbi:MAG TPA: S1 RNA-binding domain-containing protein [Anaerolineae bacterium]|nr:S1 RNA-binding domain-containing protein [Anaerolineae bacterium]